MLHVATEITQRKGIAGNQLLRFISPFLQNSQENTEVLKTADSSILRRYIDASLHNIVNIQRINDVKGINAYFKLVNRKLAPNGVFTGCVETLEQRRVRIFRKFPPVVSHLYYSVDFVYKRVFPKFKFTKRLSLYLTQGKNRALSKSEVLGRLVYCGFEIESVEEIGNLLYFKVRKAGEPLDKPEPSSGIILRIKRIGRNGEPITVYKFRTMHPYAEHLQSYIFEQHDLREGGKFANDFRITKWGRWMRKFWIDEIPMIYNIVRGDLKLVGVRPLSEHYLSLYTPEHKLLRVKGKPGLIPPFYADMPRNLDEIMESEHRYMEAWVRDPLATDFAYCMKAFNNIFLHKARSH